MDSYVSKNIVDVRQLASMHMYQDSTNIWEWTASSNRAFTLASAWHIVRSHAPIFDLADVIWFLGCIPKMACCILKALHDRLPTSARLKQFKIVSSDMCVLCNKESETITYLFFDCSYSAYVWTLCKLKLGMNTAATSLEEEAVA